MKRATYLPVVALLAVGLTRAAWAEPAWGRSCLACHDQWRHGALLVINEDGLADPDESATSAPDRGELKMFRAAPGELKTLYAEVTGLDEVDTYAVELRRLRHPGVEGDGELVYQPDCNWAEWGTNAKFYTDPFISYKWGPGPTVFVFYIDVDPDTPIDYYDLVFAVAGKHGSDAELFYDEQHFYLRVAPAGDSNDDGVVDLDDFVILAQCLAGPGEADPPVGCDPYQFRASDLDDDGDVDLADFAAFAVNFGTP